MGMADVLNWMVALAPVLLLLALFEWLDVFHLMNLGEIALLLLLGALASGMAYPISGRLLDTMPLGFSTYSRFVAPWIEEGLKGLVVIGLFARNRIGYKIDAAISGFAIGAGFSLVENILYLLRFRDLDLGVWIVRGLGTAIMHGGSVAVMAALSHRFCERSMLASAGQWRLHPLRFVPGYLAAVAIHTLFNQFPDAPLIAMLLSLLLVPLALMSIFGIGGSEARGWLATESAQHRADLLRLEAGEIPDTPSGRLIGALAGRIGTPGARALILDYWRLHTKIVLCAEERMQERLDGHRLDEHAAVDRAGFAELAVLEARLGRTTLAMLRPLLPFSRNDLWEVSELREQLRRH